MVLSEQSVCYYGNYVCYYGNCEISKRQSLWSDDWDESYSTVKEGLQTFNIHSGGQIK